MAVPEKVLGLQCATCKTQNYVTAKNKLNAPEKVVLSKYCGVCNKHTEHKEKQKLK